MVSQAYNFSNVTIYITRFTADVTTVRKTWELHITWQSIVLRLTTELCSNLLEQTADLKECGWKLLAIR